MRVTDRGEGPPRYVLSGLPAASRGAAQFQFPWIHPRNAGTSDGERGRRMTTIVVSGSTTSTVSTSVPSGTSYIVSAGGTLDVVSGGIVSGLVTISPGGTEHISSGGLVLNTSIGGGSAFGTGLQFIFSGGTASNTVVLQDGFNDPSFQIVSSGGLAVNTVLSAGDELVFAGGTASRTTVANRGLQVLFGGTAVSTSVLVNATQNVSSGGVAINTTLTGNTLSGFGKQEIFSSGFAISTTVSSAAEQFVDLGAIASSHDHRQRRRAVRLRRRLGGRHHDQQRRQADHRFRAATPALSPSSAAARSALPALRPSTSRQRWHQTLFPAPSSSTIVRNAGASKLVAGYGIARGTVRQQRQRADYLAGGFASGTTIRPRRHAFSEHFSPIPAMPAAR